MDKYIIITGGEGFVGSSLLKKLYDTTNYNLISIDCRLAGDNLPSEKIESTRVHYSRTTLTGNTRSTVALEYWVNTLGPGNIEAIFHFGEYSRVVPSLKNIETVVESNIKFTIDVLEICRKNNIRLIYSASSTRFDTLGDLDHSKCNQLPYPYFKSFIVDTLQRYGEWFKLRYNIAYFYNVFGDGQIEKGEYATVIGIWLNQFREGKPITVIGDGSQSRDFTHIDDIINGLIAIFNRGKIGGQYHLGTGKDTRLIEVANLFKDKGAKLEFLPKINAEREKGRAPLSNLARTELGWSAKHNVMSWLTEKLG